jgi:plasmid stabilization system protein ParE
VARVVVRPEAARELRATHQWYESRREGLGREFAEAVEAVLLRIAEQPFAFPRVHSETRRAVLTRFPYAVYFGLHGEDVVVLAVHGRQHPSRWQSRR